MEPRVIVVSGGSRGLGEAVVKHLLAHGDIVCTFSRHPSDFLTAASQQPEYGQRLFFQALDIADSSGVHEFMREVWRRFGRVYALINNAGIARDGVLATTSFDDIDMLVKVNLCGTLYLTRACLRFMLLSGKGRIINISSIIGLRGYNGLSVYAATKAGLDGMTRALARELGPRGVTVNSIAPGYLETEMTDSLSDAQRRQIIRRTPLGRLGTAADIIPALDFLLSPGAGFITGEVLVVDGGVTA